MKPLSVTTNVVGLQTDDADHVGQNSSAQVALVVGLQTDAVVVTETRLSPDMFKEIWYSFYSFNVRHCEYISLSHVWKLVCFHTHTKGTVRSRISSCSGLQLSLKCIDTIEEEWIQKTLNFAVFWIKLSMYLKEILNCLQTTNFKSLRNLSFPMGNHKTKL